MFSNVFIIYELNVIEFGTAVVAFETKSSYYRVAPGRGGGGRGTWVLFGWVCAARGSKLALCSKKTFP